MSFEEYQDEVEETNYQVGDFVLARAVRVNPDEGIHVRFGGAGDGFVPVEELEILNTNPDFGFAYTVDNTYWLQILDLDNSERPIQLSHIKAVRAIEGDGIDTDRLRGGYSHLTRNGSPKQRFPNRELAVQRIKAIRRDDAAAQLVPYTCRTCRYWHIGNDR